MQQITSIQNPLVKHLVMLRSNRDYRYDKKLVFIEGVKFINELLPHKIIQTIFTSDVTLIPEGFKHDRVILVSDAIMKKISSLQTMEGIAAEVVMPSPLSLKGIDRLLILDGLSDPGNLGTLLRTALALDWKGVFILDNSCDPFNDKALRAAKGATFNIPLSMGSWDDLSELLSSYPIEILIADLQGKAPSVVDKSQNLALILSNESHGVSKKALKQGKKISISMSDKVESLNVAIAGGILMNLLQK